MHLSVPAEEMEILPQRVVARVVEEEEIEEPLDDVLLGEILEQADEPELHMATLPHKGDAPQGCAVLMEHGDTGAVAVTGNHLDGGMSTRESATGFASMTSDGMLYECSMV